MKSSKLKYYITMILISLSLISIGFASWVFNVGSDISTDANGNINTDEIKREYSFEDFGKITKKKFMSYYNEYIEEMENEYEEDYDEDDE